MLSEPFASPLARRVAALFASDPMGWKAGSHYVRHSSGVSVWISNGSSGLSLETEEGDELWGVTMWCLLGGSPNQKTVWRAYRKWTADRFAARLDALTPKAA